MMYDDNATDDFWHVFFSCSVELDHRSRRMMLFFIYLMSFVVGLTANSVVLWVNWQRRHSSSPEVFCTLNMSVSHLMVMTIMPAFLLEVMMDDVWTWGSFMCHFTNFIYEFNYYSTSFFLAYLSVERYLSVTREPTATAARPWGVNEKRRRAGICAGLWIFALLLSPVMVSNMQLIEYHEPGCYLLPDRNHEFWMAIITMTSFVFQFLIPGGVILTCNWLTAQALRRSPELQSRTDVDMRMCHVYSAVFLLHWLPYHIISIIMMVDTLDPYQLNCDTIAIVYYSAYLLLSLSHFHYITNPVLYNLLRPGFRKTLLKQLARYVRRHAQLPGEDGRVEEAGGKGKPQRKMSNASTTSQSDVE
ncbi:G-protein coupled receptor 182-like [Engraulis encrasicolus]|uniref:G-protein coupled receptor 182-like n=1 Tax=Engraulis encrasicolus TaxID=184585 RepID=UPI002FD68397